MTSIQDLCTIRYLRKAVEECKAFDGWTDDEMLEYFIQKNGFNPIEELKQMKVKENKLLIIAVLITVPRFYF